MLGVFLKICHLFSFKSVSLATLVSPLVLETSSTFRIFWFFSILTPTFSSFSSSPPVVLSYPLVSRLPQDIEETMNTALNELRELERQSSAKHAPDVVLDTLEQRQTSGGGGGPTPASSSESLGPIHGVLLRSAANTEPPVRRSAGSSGDTMSTFKPVVAPRMGVQLKPPALRPKPMVLPKTGQVPAASSPQDPVDKSCTM